MRFAVPVLLALWLVMPAAAVAQSDVEARMASWSRALGVACTHCHVEGSFSDASKPTFEFAQRMSRMVAAVNAGPLKDVAAITCWTCHRGRNLPARLPRESWEKIRSAHAGEFANSPNRAIAMSVYAASLGVDCSHCHDADRGLNTKPAKAMVKDRMLAIFDEIPKHFDKVRTPVTQCYMCHQGRISPELVPR
jgi:hypothetical protein